MTINIQRLERLAQRGDRGALIVLVRERIRSPTPPVVKQFRFFLGTHHPHWLRLTATPLFISRRRLSRYRTLPRAKGPWALDSGGFTELNKFGGWATSPRQYAREVYRYRQEVGRLEWAAIQDWMCEPFVLRKTGKSIVEHQQLTVRSYLDLQSLAPDLPWAPVLQGWAEGDYLDHVEMYAREGVDLARLPIVGVGSVCRRQATSGAAQIMRRLAGLGLRLHGFGFKKSGLPDVVDHIASADSMAWSLAARHQPPLSCCVGKHASCANCPLFALRWYSSLMGSLTDRGAQQLSMF